MCKLDNFFMRSKLLYVRLGGAGKFTQISCLNKLNKFIKVYKDQLPTFSRFNVVYRIECSNCDAFYVKDTPKDY